MWHCIVVAIFYPIAFFFSLQLKKNKIEKKIMFFNCLRNKERKSYASNTSLKFTCITIINPPHRQACPGKKSWTSLPREGGIEWTFEYMSGPLTTSVSFKNFWTESKWPKWLIWLTQKRTMAKTTFAGLVCSGRFVSHYFLVKILKPSF